MHKYYYTLILSYFVLLPFGFSQVSFTFSGGTVTPNGTVDVDVSISNFDQVVLMQFSVNWDPTVLSYSSIENVTNVLPQFSEAENFGTPPIAAAVDDGELTVSWSLNSTEPVSIPDGTRLFTIRLTAVGDPCDKTTISLSDIPRAIEIVDEDFNEIAVVVTPGVVDIQGVDCDGGGGTNCDNTDNVALIASSETADEGTNICLSVTTKNFVSIASIQTGITWDPTVLTYTGINESSITDISLNEANTGNGELRLLWLVGEGQIQVTLPDDSELFQICFDLVGSNSDASMVSFVDLPNFGIEIGNEDGMSVETCIQNGTVVIGTGGGGDDCSNTQNVALIGSDAFASNGSNICIPVTTKNFTTIASAQTGITWNSSILSFTGLTEGALTDISLNEANAASGELLLLWLVGNGQIDLTIDDDEVLFELCYDVVGLNGQSTAISFVDLPNFAVEIANGNGQEVMSCLQNGMVTVGVQGEELNLIAGNVTADQGRNVCVDISVTNFINIQSAQFNVVWDESILEFDQVANITLPDFGASNANFISPNKLRVSWNPFNPTTVDDNTAIFQICYNAIGDCNTQPTSGISFISDSNIQIEFSNSDNNILPVVLNPGSVEIEPCEAGLNIISITEPLCNGQPGGSIVASVLGGVPPITCTWKDTTGNVISTSSTDCNLVGVRGGTYIVEITDASSNVFLDTVTINEPEALSLTGEITDADCDIAGSIDLTVSGGTSPYTISWDSGLGNVEDPEDLQDGLYSVTITDNNQCSESSSFIVRDNNTELLISSSTIQPRTCSSFASIDITVEGGCAPYTYIWTGPNGESMNSEDISDIAAGSWNVNVSDSNSPVKAISMNFAVEDQIETLGAAADQLTPVTCFGLSDGAIDLSVNGGCEPYFYNWSGPGGFSSSLEDIGNLEEGNYNLTLTDGAVPANTFEMSIEVPSADAIVLTTQITHVTNIGGNNGAIDLSVSGGTGELSFDWADGNSEEDRTGLLPGQYAVTVADENTCSASTTVRLMWNAVFAENINAGNNGMVSCPGETDGIIDGEPIGGCGGTEIRLNGIVVNLPVSDLGPGTYNLTLEDTCGNETLKMITISEPEPIEITVIDTVCSDQGSNNGSATISITGGTGNFQIEWSSGEVSPNGFTSSNLPIGLVSVVVEDDNGCQAADLNIEIKDCINPENPTECNERSIISPNGDGINDNFIFDCLSSGSNQPNTLNIYDRWGKLVYTQDNYDNGWTGTDLQGNELDEGGYMWILIIANPGENPRIEKGTLTLLRSNF